MLEVSFESQVHWYTDRNLLRASSNFHGKPRFDSVMVDTVDGPAFAQLVFLFTLKVSVNIGTVQLGLVRYYQPVPRESCPRYDTPVGFKRFKLCSAAASSIISLESVVHGVYMAPIDNTDGHYFLNDLIDGDIFIRMKRYSAKVHDR